MRNNFNFDAKPFRARSFLILGTYFYESAHLVLSLSDDVLYLVRSG